MVDIIVLSEPQNHRCCYCGHEMIRYQHVDGETMPRNAATRDHLEPRVYGGKTSYENMIAACLLCNNLRGELEAIAFFNLQQKWFKRDESLRKRWHSVSHEELIEFKVQCITVHVRQLNGLGRRSLEHAFRHLQFIRRWHRYPPRV